MVSFHKSMSTKRKFKFSVKEIVKANNLPELDLIFHEYELIWIKIDFDILDTPKIMILIQQILMYN